MNFYFAMNFISCGLFFQFFMSSHNHYYIDLNPNDFESNEKYLEERVKRGMQAGYSFQQCFDHWLEDFKQALDNASDQQQHKQAPDNAADQPPPPPNDK